MIIIPLRPYTRKVKKQKAPTFWRELQMAPGATMLAAASAAGQAAAGVATAAGQGAAGAGHATSPPAPSTSGATPAQPALACSSAGCLVSPAVAEVPPASAQPSATSSSAPQPLQHLATMPPAATPPLSPKSTDQPPSPSQLPPSVQSPPSTPPSTPKGCGKEYYIDLDDMPTPPPQEPMQCVAYLGPPSDDGRGFAHVCIQCKEFVHSWVVCDAVWMPKEGKYLCSRTCLVAHNVTANAAERLPVCRRPSDELEPPHLPTSTATPTPPPLLAEQMLPAPAAAADAASADAAPDSGADTSGVSSAAITATAAAAATAGAFAADSATALAPASAVLGSTQDATAASAADTVPVDGAPPPPPPLPLPPLKPIPRSQSRGWGPPQPCGQQPRWRRRWRRLPLPL